MSDLMKMFRTVLQNGIPVFICENCYNGNHMSYGFDYTKFPGRTEDFPVSDCKNIGKHPDTGDVVQCHCGFPDILGKRANIVLRFLKLADQLDKKGEYIDADIIEKRIEDLKDITKIQLSQGNWDYDEYMHGLANGMILGLATIEGKEPDYKSAPKRWLFYNDKEAVLRQLSKLVDVLNEKGLNAEANKLERLKAYAGEFTPDPVPSFVVKKLIEEYRSLKDINFDDWFEEKWRNLIPNLDLTSEGLVESEEKEKLKQRILFLKEGQLKRTYDYGEGFYSNMDKYKSVKDFRKRRRLSNLECKHTNTVMLITEGSPIKYCTDCNQVVTENKLNRGDWDKDYIPSNPSPYNDIGSNEARSIDKQDFYS